MAIDSGIYIVEHPSGAFYIGASTNLAARWRTHRRALETGRHVPLLQRLVDNGDASAFTMRTLFFASKENLKFFEERALAAFASKPGFANPSLVSLVWTDATRARMGAAKRQAIADGTWKSPTKGKRIPEATKARMSETRKRLYAEGRILNHQKGKPIPAEQRAKISTTRKERIASGEIVNVTPAKGWKHSAETRARMSEAHKGIAPFAGHKHSVEAREKMAAASRGKKQSPETIAKRIATTLQRRNGGIANGD